MVVTEFGTPMEIETKIDDRLLTLDLLRLLSNKRFFGGRLGGESILTREMSVYLKYCQQIGTAVVSTEGVNYPADMDMLSP